MGLRTAIVERFGIEHPVLNAPMGGGDAPAALAAAVSEGGGLGLIGGTTYSGADWVHEQIARARELTTRPFGIGFISHLPGAAELQAIALDAGVPVIAHSFADPTPFVAAAHRGGAVVIAQVRTVDEAKRAADGGVDVITAQGTEAGGHTGRVATLPLVPAVIDAVAPLPVVAAGGIADGRGLAAMLVLGAAGGWLGTRFLATPEAGVPEGYKERVLTARGDDTVLTEVFDLASGMPWPEDVAGRALQNAFTERWHGRERELRSLNTDARPRPALDDPDEMPLYAGQAAALVHEREGAADLVRRLARDAERVLRERPPTLLR